MEPKSPNHKNRRRAQIATNISRPGYSIGSPESRAIARSIVGQFVEREGEQKQHEEIDQRCRKWVASHKSGPMYWLRNWTKTENYHYIEQGLDPVMPFPFDPFTDGKDDLSLLPFEHEFGVGKPCELCDKKFGFTTCVPDYLDVIMGIILRKDKLLRIPKSREMMTSWLVVGFITWFCQFHGMTEAFSQSENDSKVRGLIKYANILYTNQEPWMKARHPLKRGEEGTQHNIAWANGSTFTALPSGERKLAGAHPTVYFMDEAAHIPAAEATINIAMPACRQIIAVSSVAPGWFADSCGC